MRFFVDQCVPESVAKTLERHGHEVIRLRERIAPDSPDTLVAAVSEANNATLGTMDGDAKTIASRYGVGSRRYRRLSILRFERCRESRAAKRIDEAMSLIEHEWEVGGGRESQDRRMLWSLRTGRFAPTVGTPSIVPQRAPPPGGVRLWCAESPGSSSVSPPPAPVPYPGR